MYIQQTQCGYDRNGQQTARRGRFLLLLQLEGKPCNASNTYAVVRKVALSQLGQFMMGRAKLGAAWRSVSGAYGNDGLPVTVESLPKDAKLLPAELYNAWNKGGGWNGAGNEASAMRAWAISAF